ncbi:tyrosine-type recombinase/integrase [Xanthomonas translucens]|uniref:tyrosine-type recombinase/integrase n=1 Tax=Xanthomonas campestris pv. translucens TaxID=343 RepID=UPI001E59F4EC|nr:tyrosine-type recombinase/integrase [Xanthomonas translucens]
MATIYERGGRWYLNWRDQGVQFRRSLGPIEKRQAEALRTEKEAELRGLITVTRGVTVRDVMDEYMAWYKDARAGTFRQATSALRRFREKFDRYGAEALFPGEVEAWAAKEERQGQTEKALKLSRAAFNRALKHRTISRSPMLGVSIPKSKTSRAPPYYRPSEMRKLAAAVHGALWVFLANTGLRRAEIAKARRADIRDGMIYVESEATGRTKNLRWRAVPLNAAAKASLKHLGKDRLIEAEPDTLTHWSIDEARDAGLKGSMHWLRHTFCTSLVQSGVSLHQVKELAGHSSIAVTERYAHHAPGHGKDAVSKIGSWSRRK